MNQTGWPRWGLLVVIPLVGCTEATAADEPTIAFEMRAGSLFLRVGDQPLATYVYQDEKITRPYFAHVRAPGGLQVTRNHPPVDGKDPADHATFHPGVWMAFGDVGGADNWRLKARVKHVEFVEKPKGGAGVGTFAVKNEYLANDGRTVVCTETCRFTLRIRPAGYILLWDSEFRGGDSEFAFGDQEEMGLGVRVATPLLVKHGGEIRTSKGDKNEKEVRGKAADWCDYSGLIDGKRIGITLLCDSKNFRPSWYHARDYGLLVANPFGRKALTGGETSRVLVKKGDTLRLRYGVLLHASKTDKRPDLDAAYKDFLSLLGPTK